MAFSELQFHSLQVVERFASSLSLVGTLFIMITFLSSSHFRKLINRLIFYASFGNIFMSIGTLISREGIKYGPDSPLCQFQAFLLHDFMFADALWTLAMAVNAYLVIFRKYDIEDLKRLEKWYLLVCYGLPFIPAFAFCFVDDGSKGRMFGSATIWCWISAKWGIARIVSIYIWIWTLMVAIMVIYILVGREVWRRYRDLNDMQRSYPPPGPTNVNPRDDTKIVSVGKVHYHNNHSGTFYDDEERLSCTDKGKSYDITISYSPTPPCPVQTTPDAYSVNVTARSFSFQSSRGSDHAKPTALRTYIQTAFLFWIIFVITWMPSSINRVYSLVQNDRSPSYALSMLSCITLPLQGFWNAVVFTVVGTRGWKKKEAVLSRLRAWMGGNRSYVETK